MVATSLFLIAGVTLAVHDLSFELDGNIVQDGGSTYDWANFFDSSGNPSPVLPDASLPGFTASAFKADFSTTTNHKGDTVFDTSDPSTFTVGSKDILDVSGWSCTAANNVTDKGDIMNAYAVAYTDPGTGDEILYFALERNSNTGDANVAFWFLQGDVSCDTSSGTANWSGNHVDGDLLIVSAFTKGGDVSTINAYRWNGGADGSLGTTPVASGGDCRSTTISPGDSACATANEAAITGIPWLTENKTDGVDHSLQTGEFFEGGINLTQTNLGDRCFNTFVADTRSSQSLTATLYDYALGNLGECKTDLSTTAELNTSGATIDSSNTSANGTVSSGTDAATLTVSGVETWAGTLNFYLCGPLTSGVCDSSGVLVTSRTVTQASSGSDFVSDAVTLTSAGDYCWYASFTPDGTTADKGVLGKTDDGSGSTPNTECFTVSPAQPSLTTLAGTSPVDLGNSVSDTATLSGAAKEPGNDGADHGGNAAWPSINATNGAFVGTIGFTLKGLDYPTQSPPVCATTAASPFTGELQTFPITETVTGNGGYGPVSYAPKTPGDYHWVATYSYSGTAVNNVLPATHNADCSDGSEDVEVLQVPTSMTTTQKVFPQDSATITSSLLGDNLPSSGTVIFRLYEATTDGTPSTALQNCQAHGTTLDSGGLIYVKTLTNVGGSHSVTVTTENQTDVAVDANGIYYWYVTYEPGDSAHLGTQSDCAESTELTFINDPAS